MFCGSKRRHVVSDCDLVTSTFVVVALLVTSAPAFCQSPAVGRVKSASGAAFILRQGSEIPVQAGAGVFEADGLRTGPDGHLALTLRDDTRVSLDPNSELRLDRFAYAPAAGHLAFVMKIVRGAVAYVSGRIAKLSPEAVRIEMPNAILGVRGTRLVIRAGAP